jgi:hypothetical protein
VPNTCWRVVLRSHALGPAAGARNRQTVNWRLLPAPKSRGRNKLGTELLLTVSLGPCCTHLPPRRQQWFEVASCRRSGLLAPAASSAGLPCTCLRSALECTQLSHSGHTHV